MKYLVISDIHGSSFYMKEALRVYKEEKCNKILILGDILYHGPRNDLPKDYNPKEVISLLNPLKNEIIAVLGNCEAPVDLMVLDFPIFKEAVVTIDDINYYLTHGDIYNIENPLNVSEGVVLYGHSHISSIKKIDNVYYINPGSISIPKGNKVNSYIIIDNKKVSIKDFNGNTLESIKL